jgi:hypothetical protein
MRLKTLLAFQAGYEITYIPTPAEGRIIETELDLLSNTPTFIRQLEPHPLVVFFLLEKYLV